MTGKLVILPMLLMLLWGCTEPVQQHTGPSVNKPEAESLAGTTTVASMPRSTKRGVSFGIKNVTDAFILSDFISWHYNWGNTPSGTDNVQIFLEQNNIDFCPMCWNGNYSKDRIRAFVQEHPNTRYLLGFNEPNLTDQANMTPQKAAELWPDVVALAKELNLKLGAPAMNYGTSCGGLETPSIASISADSVITINEVTGAESYKLTFYYNGAPYYYQTGVHSGDKINFPAIAAATYVVTVIAQASGANDSDESEGYNWTLAGRTVEIGTSEYCTYEITPNWWEANTDPYPWRMYLTFQTINGDIVITITGPDGDPGTSFRGADALGINNFSINGVPGNNFFTLTSADGSTEYRLSPKEGMTIPEDEVISYTGNLQWRTSLQGNGYTEGSHLEYTYGSVCASLQKPVITAISDEQVPALNNVEGAETFLIQVMLDYIIVYTTTIHAGEAINFVPRVSDTYQVVVVARAEGMSESEPSDPYNWQLTAVPFESVPSKLCAEQVNGAEGGVAYLSWNTAQNGDVYVEISGEEGTTYRGEGLTFGNFIISSAQASLFFDLDYSTGSTVYRLQKKDGAKIGAGMLITYTGHVEWLSPSAPNGYILNANYSYTYGTQCAEWEDPTIDDNTVGLDNVEQTHYTQKLLIGGQLYISGDYDADEDGHIILENLSAGLTYNISVRAKDQAANLSNTIQVRFTTISSETAVNIALNKPALAGTTEGDNTANKAVDGNDATKWGNYGKVSAENKEDNYWQVNLERAYTLDSVRIKWQHFPDYGGLMLQGSFNGTDFFDIISYPQTPKFEKGTTQTIEMPEGCVTQYLRIKNNGTTNTWYMSFYEFEVYGTGGVPVLVLDETVDNNAAILERADNEVMATLNRSFLADGYWYTLCLPFALTEEQLKNTYGAGYRLSRLDDSEMHGTMIYLDFHDVNNLDAGVPYLFMPGQDTDAPQVFTNVTVNNASTRRHTSLADMVGFYQPTVVEAPKYFLSTSNYLVQNTTGNATKAFRAYFDLDPGVPNNVQARIRMGGNAATGVEQISDDNRSIQYDNYNTQKVLRNGHIYIIREGNTYTVTGERVE